jgi:hypothetical protein
VEEQLACYWRLKQMLTFQPLETVRRVVPLGLRCIDVATQRTVFDGLSVKATSLSGSSKSVSAFINRSGIFAFQCLPGLYDFEYGVDASVLAGPPIVSPAKGKEFAIRIEDTQGRFLSVGLILTLPRRDVLSALLFSAPNRACVPGFTVIRGEIKDATLIGSLRPASFARIEAQYELTNPPTIYAAIADARGQFALFLPPPNPFKPPAGIPVTSPNTSGRQTLSQLRWPITIQFFYQPQRQKFICANARGQIEIVEGEPESLVMPTSDGQYCLPELASLLMQSAAGIFAATSALAAATLQTEIMFGQEVVLRTVGGDSAIWIAPPFSSP